MPEETESNHNHSREEVTSSGEGTRMGKELTGEIVPTWHELKGLWRVFAMSEWIMRDRVSFFDEIKARRDLDSKLISMVSSTMIHLALYGMVMGLSNSFLQALVSALKLPALFLATLVICLPTLYFFDLLYGSQLTFKQTAALMMSAISVTAALTLAFTSITLFLWMTVGNQYTILILINIGVLAISSWWGLVFLRQGMKQVQGGVPRVPERRILTIWLLIYAFVGTQMAWSLRPFFGVPGEPFVLVRGGGGTFVESVVTALGWLLKELLGFL